MQLIRLVYFIMLHLAPIVLSGQMPDLQLTLRYDLSLSRYEVLALPSATQPSFYWGPSQISVVTPSSVPDEAFSITFLAGGAWNDNSRIYAPLADPVHDYHGIGSLGALTNLTANVEKLLFHFTLPGGGCVTDLRLFINGVDPNSSAPGMSGGDFSNTVFAIVPGAPNGYEAYVNNYNNGGTVCTALPLELISFDATATEASVSLQWASLTENAFSHFELERSEGDGRFVLLANIPAANAARFQYHFLDTHVATGHQYYYRLKMVDSDASFVYSSIVRAAFGQQDNTISIQPNPVRSIMFINFDLPEEMRVQYWLTDATGRLIQRGDINGLKGPNRYEFNLQDYVSGIYYLSLLIGDNQLLTANVLKID